MKKFLIIQTAFIGDVILATAVLEKLHLHYPAAQIDILLRKGNESLFDGHPFLHEVIIWDKKGMKYANLLALVPKLRRVKYDLVVNLHRYLSSGILTVLSGGARTVGFDKNPLSLFFSERFQHQFGGSKNKIHEVERCQSLIAKETDSKVVGPKLYPFETVGTKIKKEPNYLTISPGSVWFTKQLPVEKWLSLMDGVGEGTPIFLLGGGSEHDLCEQLKEKTRHPNVTNLAGSFTFLQSAALMRGAKMNFVNDSAPLHLASAVNAPVTAVFCSTVPEFGFFPLSDDAIVVEAQHKLPCPCGLHGFAACPQGHFKCSNLPLEKLLDRTA